MELLDSYYFGEGEYEDALAELENIKQNGIPLTVFKTLRTNQVEALERILKALKDNKRNVILVAPTGSGKSAIAAALAQILHKVLDEKSYLLPPSRDLQDQYIKSMIQSPFFKVAKGADNYRCTILTRDTDPKYRNGKVVGDKDSLTYTTANSPCRRDSEIFDSEFMPSQVIEEYKDEWFKTVHRDQDTKVRSRAHMTDYESVVTELPEESVANPNFSLIGWNVRKYCRNHGACPHMLAREVADMAPAAILSLNMLCFYIHSGASDMTGCFYPRGVHIFDEAHNLEGSFREILSSGISEKAFSKAVSRIDFNESKIGKRWDAAGAFKLLGRIHTLLEHKIWNQYVLSVNQHRVHSGLTPYKNLAEYLKDKGGEGGDIDPDDENYKKLVTWFKNSFYAVEDYKKFGTRPWQREYHFWVEEDRNGCSLRIAPILLGKYCKKFLANHVNLYMSATIPDTRMFCDVLGLHPSTVEVITMPDLFPVQAHPIFLEPIERNTTSRLREIGALRLNLGSVEDLSKDQKDEAYQSGADSVYDKTSVKLKESLDKFSTLKGVGFVTGYSSVTHIKRRMGDNPRLMFAENSDENRAQLDVFKELPEDSDKVFISAGIKEGHSFDDNMSRLQYIFKVPFSPPGEMMNLLNSRYPGYKNVQTAIALQQQVGRSMRSETDFCITIVFDLMLADIMKDPKHYKYYSQSFRDSIQWKGDWRKVVFDSEKISY